MEGIQAPVGFFDPLGLSKAANDKTLLWFRAHQRRNFGSFVFNDGGNPNLGRVSKLVALSLPTR